LFNFLTTTSGYKIIYGTTKAAMAMPKIGLNIMATKSPIDPESLTLVKLVDLSHKSCLANSRKKVRVSVKKI